LHLRVSERFESFTLSPRWHRKAPPKKLRRTPTPNPSVPPQAIPLSDVAERIERLENSTQGPRKAAN
jgi:hypothetical protein